MTRCIQVEGEIGPRCIRLRTTHLGCMLDSLMQIDRRQVHLQLAFADAGQIEEIVDQPRLEFDIPANQREGFTELFRFDEIG